MWSYHDSLMLSISGVVERRPFPGIPLLCLSQIHNEATTETESSPGKQARASSVFEKRSY
jgi:hypothetical protein